MRSRAVTGSPGDKSSARIVAATCFWAASLSLLLCGAGSARSEGDVSWLGLVPGRVAMSTNDEVVCSSLEGLRAELLGHMEACTVWRSGLIVTIRKWENQSLTKTPHFVIPIATVVRQDGHAGVTMMSALIPIIPKGTEIVLQRPCSFSKVTGKHAYVAGQGFVNGKPVLYVTLKHGTPLVVSVYDVITPSGRPVFIFLEPNKPEFKC